MRPYETMIIFDLAVDAQEIQGALDRSLEAMKAAGGTPGQIDRWGKRTLAYEMKKRREAYYVVVEFTGEPATVAALDRHLTLAPEVLRHKILRLPEKGAARRVAAGAA
ncbi:MAG TPA: 30S ribosomal protein S6 [Acidimicrobiales bacterium]|jgi:small subunit ribosomal protein S6|nr:30S ribosomal protein S6 [Acidimicrobiales bacterium]